MSAPSDGAFQWKMLANILVFYNDKCEKEGETQCWFEFQPTKPFIQTFILLDETEIPLSYSLGLSFVVLSILPFNNNNTEFIKLIIEIGEFGNIAKISHLEQEALAVRRNLFGR